MVTLVDTGQEYIDSLKAEAFNLRKTAATFSPRSFRHRTLVAEAYATERVVWVLEDLYIGKTPAQCVRFKFIGSVKA
jgi:hypothetical protein